MTRLAVLILLGGCGSTNALTPVTPERRIQDAAAEIRNDADADVDRIIERMGPVEAVATNEMSTTDGGASEP